ncbi:GGDEF domain-containing protein [Thalassospira mesophila]|uniref:diguanylate cyclase n=1 Tax=Thalassospira mesophila TaxID=1293891 RepID=A0A1Y2L108_9PROT|nr:GGDEF domain-containing protein [Thalassospira mesophila]OSQ38910.1 hypothetical protein TMES_09270 [Thalassospira mesophila]
MKDVDLHLLQALLREAESRLNRKDTPNEKLANEFSLLIEHARSLQTRLDQSETRIRQLENLVDMDELTGLYNRRGFTRQLKQALASGERHTHPTQVIIADLDGFKQTNDQYGHAAGDAILRHFARLIQKQLRGADFAARLGGDEFAVVLRHATTDGTASFIKRLQSTLGRSAVLWQHQKLPVQASFGFATSTEDAGMAQLLNLADQDMYRHKHAHRTMPDETAPRQPRKRRDVDAA